MKRPKTLGGTQFWRDRVVIDDHRLPQHVRFGRVRVLDAEDRRIHTGVMFTAAHAAFTKAVGKPKQHGDHLVMLLHGYGGRTSRMFALRDAARAAGFVAEVIQYPSFFRTIDELAGSIADLIIASAAHHRGRIKTVSLVAFSMGGLVASAVMAKLAQRRGAPRLGSLVTIGTPHLGSPIAGLTTWLAWLGGPNISELLVRDRRELAVLPVPLGVVAGRGHRNGWTLLGLMGDGDGIVELVSALGSGASDQLVIDGVKHARLANNEAVIDAVVRFLATGRFAARSVGLK